MRVGYCEGESESEKKSESESESGVLGEREWATGRVRLRVRDGELRQ